MDKVFSLVDPKDVRWVYLSHDDHDHVGNLLPVLDACPQATLVTTWFSVERPRGDYALPLDRMRWVNDGESFDVGDRTLVAVTPPVFDNPTSRGLFDGRTGVYWAVDAFASLMAEPGLTTTADIQPEFWEETFLYLNRMISPWHTLVDPTKFDRHVDKVARLPITSIAAAHTTAVRGPNVAEAIRLIRRIARMDPAVVPAQADLDAILAVLAPEAGEPAA